jgi:peptide deformylase
MVDTMEAMPGVGLAAPQIGVNLRLCVVDASETRGQAVRMADPVLRPVVEYGTMMSYEASPCLPGVGDKVERNQRVIAEFTNEDGQRVTREFEGLWAASVQHQLDHLNGKLFIDKLSRVKRDMAVRKFMKAKGKA